MPQLKKVEFDCTVITPMFLAGADKNKPELRVPSLRGELRWWLRALLGGYLNAKPDEVLKQESRLLGDASENGQSKFTIRVKCEAFNTQKKPALPHKQGKQQAHFMCIPEETRFSVVFQSSSASEVERKVCTSVFEVFALLGGLGRRSRRAFGNFQPNSWSFENVDNVRNFVKEKIQNAHQAVQEWLGEQATGLNLPTPYPVLSANSAEIRIAKESQRWENFIKKLMQEISKALRGRDLKPKVLGGINPRQASTMIVSVVRLENKEVVPIFTNFICGTALEPKENDFGNIKQFSESKFNATLLQV